MKKFTPLLFVCLFSAISCDRGQVLKINGRVDNPVFDGSKAYIVTSSPTGEGKEDSAIIRNGRFAFTIPADTFTLRSVFIPRKGLNGVQELLFIAEPGTLDVVMSEKSNSSGTRLNGMLMEWKKNNFAYDSIQYDLYYLAGNPGITRSAYDSIMKLSATIDSIYMAGNLETINRNTGNGIGLFFFKFYYDHLPLDAKKTILEKTGDLYLNLDKQVWSKVMFDPEIPKENGMVKYFSR